jgi:Ca2+/H+ antiporter
VELLLGVGLCFVLGGLEVGGGMCDDCHSRLYAPVIPSINLFPPVTAKTNHPKKQKSRKLSCCTYVVSINPRHVVVGEGGVTGNNKDGGGGG